MLAQITDFTIKCLGVEYPGRMSSSSLLGPDSKYAYACYGLGDTETEALDDCLETLAAEIGLDPQAELAIRERFGVPDDCLPARIGKKGDHSSTETPYWYVCMKWNIKGREYDDS